MASNAPLPASERVHLLDALRGFAIFGMWIVNMTVDVGWSYRIELMPLAQPDFAVVTLVQLLFSGKFFTIFSFLFGVGVFVQIERAKARGDNRVAFFLRRSTGLLIISFLAIAVTLRVWILVDYAIVGIAVLLFADRTPKTILRGATACLLFAVVFSDAIPAYRDLAELRSEAESGGVTVETVAAMRAEEEIERGLARDARVRSGTFLESARISVVRWVEAQGDPDSWVERIGILGLMLIGLYVAQRGAVRGVEIRRDIARRTLPWLLGIGAVCTLYSVISIDFDVGNSFSTSQRIVEQTFRGWFGSSLMGLGYAAAFTLLFDREKYRRGLSSFAPVGRMALTCYIVTNLVAEYINLGWGLGQFGNLGPTFGFVFVLLAFPVMAAGAHQWLEYFRFGAAEWLWRSLTYARLQPMRLSPG